jgi:Ca2+-binding RTX toxin-like protein
VAVAGLAALCLLGATASAGAVHHGASCVYVPETRQLFVIIKRIAAQVPADTPDGQAVVGRYGDQLAVIAGDSDAPIPCSGGEPTVFNTDQIFVRRAATVDSAELGVDLRQGLFAPGVTPERDGTPEIELAADLGRGKVVVAMTTGSDQVLIGTANGAAVVDLNGIEQIDDVDLAAGRSSLVVYGGLGDDVLNAAPSAGLDPAGVPTRGTTRLGGPGDDLLAGTSRTDLVQGDRGTDLVAAGGGSDVVLGFDRRVDRIDCGAGNDRFVYVDRSDELRDCERARFSDPAQMRNSSQTGNSTVRPRVTTLPIVSPVP